MEKNEKKFNECCEKKFAQHCKDYYKAKNSANARASAAKKFVKFINEKEKKLDVIDFDSVEEFFDFELEHETSPVTVNNYYSYLKGFFAFLRKEHYNEKMDYVKVKIDRIKKIEYGIFKDDELKEIFEIIDNEKNEQIKLSNRILFNLMFYTGCTLNEVYSLNVYEEEGHVLDDDNYIVLETKKIYFRNPNSREFKLFDNICTDILNYRKIILKKLNKQSIPPRSSLFITTYAKADKIKSLTYSSLQNRMTVIKRRSSFADKKLSLKNIRHTLIKKLIDKKQPLEMISESIGIDISTLKFYINNNAESKIEEYFYENHPFKSIIRINTK